MDPKIQLLTEAERLAVRSTWAAVMQNGKEFSMKVFLKYLTMYPEQRKKFRAFSHVRIENLGSNKAFAGHTYSAFAGYDAVIKNLEDSEMIAEMLARLGERHVKRWIKPRDIIDFCNVLVNTMKDDFAQLMTAEASSGWGKVMNFSAHFVELGMMGFGTGSKAVHDVLGNIVI